MAELQKTGLNIGSRKPEVEINKPDTGRFWRQPNNLWWLYILGMLASMWLWEAMQSAAQEQIPYSEFLQHLDKNEVKEVVLSDQVITGTLAQIDPKTHEPRAFVTQRPDNEVLANRWPSMGSSSPSRTRPTGC